MHNARALLAASALACALGAVVPAAQAKAKEKTQQMPDVRLLTLDPGHFHAGLIQKEKYPGVTARVDVYAPLGPALVEHLTRVAAFNRRADRPTAWELEVHSSADYF